MSALRDLLDAAAGDPEPWPAVLAAGLAWVAGIVLFAFVLAGLAPMP